MPDYVAPYQPWLDEMSALGRNSATPFLKAVLLDVIRDFCRRSTAWRDVVYNYSIYEGSRLVSLNPNAADRKITQVLKVCISDTPLTLHSFYEGTTAATPTAFTAIGDDPSEIKLDVIPDEAQEAVLSALVAFEPLLPEECLPSILTTQFYEAIRAGALARMYGHAGMPYANEKMFMVMSRRYSSEVNQARARAEQGFLPGPVNWAYPSFA